MDPRSHPAVARETRLGGDGGQDRPQHLARLAQRRKETVPAHAVHQPAEAALGRTPEAGMAAEIGQLAARDAAEAKAPILRMEEELARPPEGLGKGLGEPEKLAPYIEAAHQRWGEGLREGRCHAVI